MRDKAGQVVVGKQYQNHNPTPGPVYAGGGYVHPSYYDTLHTPFIHLHYHIYTY